MSDVDYDQILRGVIPQWHQASFVFMESTAWWAPSVQAELSRADIGWPGDSVVGPTAMPTVTDFRCVSVTTTRAAYEQIRDANVEGAVLFPGKQMRDSLLLLGRLSRLCRPLPPVLMIIPQQSRSLMPLLLESGAASVMSEGVSDRTVATWCRRVAGRS